MISHQPKDLDPKLAYKLANILVQVITNKWKSGLSIDTTQNTMIGICHCSNNLPYITQITTTSKRWATRHDTNTIGEVSKKVRRTLSHQPRDLDPKASVQIDKAFSEGRGLINHLYFTSVIHVGLSTHPRQTHMHTWKEKSKY